MPKEVERKWILVILGVLIKQLDHMNCHAEHVEVYTHVSTKALGKVRSLPTGLAGQLDDLDLG